MCFIVCSELSDVFFRVEIISDHLKKKTELPWIIEYNAKSVLMKISGRVFQVEAI